MSKFSMELSPIDPDLRLTEGKNANGNFIDGRLHPCSSIFTEATELMPGCRLILHNGNHAYYNSPKNRKQAKHNMLGYCRICGRKYRKYKKPTDSMTLRMDMVNYCCKRCLTDELVTALQNELQSEFIK